MNAIDEPATPPTAQTNPRRILIVDDEASIRDVLKTYLAGRQYQVTTAGSAAETFEILDHAEIDLIVLDVCLGDEDGVALTAKLKKSHPNRPVIVVSGNGDDQHLKRQALDHGASDYVSKTGRLEDLHLSIERTLAVIPKVLRPSAPPRRRGGLVYTAPATAKELRGKSTSAKASPAPKPSEAGSEKEHSGSLPLAAPPRETEPLNVAESGTGAGRANEASPPRGVMPADPAAIAALTALTADGARLTLGLEVFLRMLAGYDANLANTAMRAVVLCKATSELLELPMADRQNLLWAAALQDIGLVRIDLNVVHRWQRDPASCSKAELALLKRHPQFSQQMIECYPALKIAGEIILAHHENWDGSGFLAGLRMEMIPWLARLVSAVTSYCSRHAPSSRTLAELKIAAGRDFDPQAIEALASAVAVTALPIGERALLASELKPGMITVADVLDAEGSIVIGRGAELNSATLARVVNLIRSAQIGSRVLVTA